MFNDFDVSETLSEQIRKLQSQLEQKEVETHQPMPSEAVYEYPTTEKLDVEKIVPEISVSNVSSAYHHLETF